MDFREQVNIIIPSLDPDERLVNLINQLQENGYKHIIVIDDGNTTEKKELFYRVKDMGVTVLTHSVNMGKGAALKSAFMYIIDNDLGPSVTCDDDGQHTIADVNKICDELELHPESLIIGSRYFTKHKVPWKSRLGNNFTSHLYKRLHKQNIKDTQSGLRGIPKSFYKELLEVKGNRYEYELNMLIAWGNREIIEIPIETIYEGGKNETTHFRPIVDSIRVTKALLTTRRK